MSLHAHPTAQDYTRAIRVLQTEQTKIERQHKKLTARGYSGDFYPKRLDAIARDLRDLMSARARAAGWLL